MIYLYQGPLDGQVLKHPIKSFTVMIPVCTGGRKSVLTYQKERGNHYTFKREEKCK